MMLFRVRIACDNAAFVDDEAAEVARILEELASDLRGNRLGEDDGHTLRDVNGNTVGGWHYGTDHEAPWMR